MDLVAYKNQDWYVSLIEDCEAIIVEKEFESRISLVEGYHELGKRILSDSDKFDTLESAINEVALSIKKSRRTIFYAVKFAKVYPDLSFLKEGKNISWSKVIKNHLTDSEVEEVLPALPHNDILVDIVKDNAVWLVENLKQNKKGINLFLPMEKIENEIL